MNQLSWFKFCPSKWAMGRTRKLSPEDRDEYLDLCCAYWIADCQMDEETMQENSDRYSYFVSKGLVQEDGIQWLNDQFDKLNDTREKRRKAGAKGGKAKASKVVANAKQVLSNSQAKPKQILADRREEIEEKEKIDRREEIKYPYLGSQILRFWDLWKDYRDKEHKFKYKSLGSEQASLKKLSNLATNEDEAIKIIEQSMAQGWKGFFELKKETNGSRFNQDDAEKLLNHLNRDRAKD